MATIKQRKAIEKIMDKHGSISAAMREVGYTNATAKNPKNLTESDGWKELMGEYLSDKLLAERHQELLNKREVHRIGHGEDAEYEMSDEPDTQAVSKALDMAYKLKGSYAAEKTLNTNININSSPDEIDKFKTLREKYEQELLSQIGK